MEHFHNELIYHILNFLDDVKVCRYAAVCKRWRLILHVVSTEDMVITDKCKLRLRTYTFQNLNIDGLAVVKFRLHNFTTSLAYDMCTDPLAVAIINRGVMFANVPPPDGICVRYRLTPGLCAVLFRMYDKLDITLYVRRGFVKYSIVRYFGTYDAYSSAVAIPMLQFLQHLIYLTQGWDKNDVVKYNEVVTLHVESITKINLGGITLFKVINCDDVINYFEGLM